MTDRLDSLLWAYRTVFKQTNAGGGNIVINVVANERTVILHGIVGPDDYAAGRTITTFLRDAVGGNAVAIVDASTALDQQRLAFPQSVAGANKANEFESTMVLGKGDVFEINAASLVLNEEVTLQIRALIRSWPPTISTTGSTGTVTTTLTYDKVI